MKLAARAEDAAPPLRWPCYDERQIAAVTDVLRSGRVNAWTGPHVSDFERRFATYLGRRHAIAVANGSLALDLALHALGIGPGDEVIVTPRSFVASAACVALAGARPIFADIDRDSQTLTADTIAATVTERTRAVIVVHLAGWPCEMEPIMRLAGRHGFAVIEDCAQAHGAEIAGRPVGSFGDAAVFSFCQDKIISTGGEGGLVAMDDGALFERAWSMKDHGKSPERMRVPDTSPGFRWLHGSFGTNMRMTALQAVIGSVQLDLLPDWRAARAENAAVLLEGLVGSPAVRVPRPPVPLRHAHYRLYAFAVPEAMERGWTRDRIVAEVSAAGVPCFQGSCPEIYLEDCFREAGFGPAERLPVARELGETSLAFLVDPSIPRAEQRVRARIVREVLDRACGQD